LAPAVKGKAREKVAAFTGIGAGERFFKFMLVTMEERRQFRRGKGDQMDQTQEELRRDMVDALENARKSIDHAEREGKLLSRPAIAMLCANVTETVNAYKAACS
jgi:hypothetical protein